MITMKQFFDLIDYKITESSEHLWSCFGDNAQSIDSWNQDHNGHTLSMTFDRKDQTVYCVEACDYSKNRAYRLINPLFKSAHSQEVKVRGIDDVAWEDVRWTDLDTIEDFLTKATAIRNQEEYDTRVSVPIDLDDHELFNLMKLAHEQDITLNQLVENILQTVIDKENGKIKSTQKAEN